MNEDGAAGSIAAPPPSSQKERCFFVGAAKYKAATTAKGLIPKARLIEANRTAMGDAMELDGTAQDPMGDESSKEEDHTITDGPMKEARHAGPHGGRVQPA